MQDQYKLTTIKSNYDVLIFIIGAEFQFTEGDYTRDEEDGQIVVTVRQVVASLMDIHLRLIPLTYDQYNAHRNSFTPPLAPIDEFHRGRGDAAECEPYIWVYIN